MYTICNAIRLNHTPISCVLFRYEECCRICRMHFTWLKVEHRIDNLFFCIISVSVKQFENFIRFVIIEHWSQNKPHINNHKLTTKLSDLNLIINLRLLLGSFEECFDISNLSDHIGLNSHWRRIRLVQKERYESSDDWLNRWYNFKIICDDVTFRCFYKRQSQIFNIKKCH